MREVWRWFLVVTGIAACPCHFPVTLPLAIGALGATGVGALLAEHSGWVYAAGWAYFIVAIAAGILWARSPNGRRARQRRSARARVGSRAGLRAGEQGDALPE